MPKMKQTKPRKILNMDFTGKDKPGNRKWTDQGKPLYTKETTGRVIYTLKTLICVLPYKQRISV